MQEQPAAGNENIINKPLVNRDRISLSPLHIKQCLMKNSVMALDKNCASLIKSPKHFLDVVVKKLKAITLDGPQICKLFKDQTVVSQLA